MQTPTVEEYPKYMYSSVVDKMHTLGGTMKPEESARQDIDKVLQDAGWAVQDRKRLNLGAGLGVARA